MAMAFFNQATTGATAPLYMFTTQAATATYMTCIQTAVAGQTGTVGGWVNAISSPVARLRLQCGESYDLPDGSKLLLDDLGNYRVEDAYAKVVYKASCVREFNPYINASDLLEHFIEAVGVLDGVDQGEILRLPIEAFINWLILQAAKRDGDCTRGLPTVEQALPPPPRLSLPSPTTLPRPRCAACGRFIRKAWAAARILFCSPEHMQLKLTRLAT